MYSPAGYVSITIVPKREVDHNYCPAIGDGKIGLD